MIDPPDEEAEEVQDDPSSAVTAVLPHIRRPEHRPRYVGPYCPLCVRRDNAAWAPMIFDPRHYALGICTEHLEALKFAPDDVYDLLIDQQYHAVFRWMHPDWKGEQ